MGLDIYVGSLTRYYAGDWELVTAKAARELGTEFRVVRKHDPPDAIRNPDDIRPIVLNWRKNLSESLVGSFGERFSEPLDWDESPSTPYFTDKPAWDGYQGLLLWAAYEEHPEHPRPKFIPEHFDKDPAIQMSMNEHKTRYLALLSNAVFWFPSRFPFVFEAPDAKGDTVTMASSYSLAQELNELNMRTWKMNDDEIDRVAAEGCEYQSPLEVAARFAFALFRRHALLSIMHRLPMLLDW